jgi:biopolymer transport protein ExbB
VRFVAADDKTPLKYHIEHWDAVNELALVWVKVPKVAPGSTADFIWLYFGNQKATREDDAKGSYDSATALVLHFNGAVADVSAAGAALTQSGVAALAQGPIDGALTFAGAGELRVAASDALAKAQSSGITFSTWVRIAAAQSDAVLFTLGEPAAGLTVGIAGTKPFARVASASAQSASEITLAQWHHVAATFAGGQLILYVDGKPAAQTAAPAPSTQGEGRIGVRFTGELDEVQVATVARTSDWIKAAWAGQGAEAKLASLGQDEQAAGASHSYFRILLSAVTLDGWVVIAILGVMMVISIVVMVGKALFVSRTDSANRTFLRVFQRNPSGMLEPGRTERAPADLQGSSLFRLYNVGLSELTHRFSAYDAQGRARNLSPQALDAIKASLDAGMVRESARLNQQVVLLTIAISGGPFLGLLGTVVGVMITFAAIAAAGDVNVNAIAPGIAAALVATVAGLGVAIPALFGYNYLATRIKNLSNDMSVFTDELVTRMAEKYAP